MQSMPQLGIDLRVQATSMVGQRRLEEETQGGNQDDDQENQALGKGSTDSTTRQCRLSTRTHSVGSFIRCPFGFSAGSEVTFLRIGFLAGIRADG